MKWFIWCGDLNGGYGKRDFNFANFLKEQGETVTKGGHVLADELDVHFPPSKLVPKRLVGLKEISALDSIDSNFLNNFDIVYGKFKHKTKAFIVNRGIGDITQRNACYPTTPFNTYIDHVMLKRLKQSNVIISISPDETQWLKKQGIKKVIQSTNFYDPTIFKPIKTKKCYDVLFVGRNAPIKNLKALKEACKKLKLKILNKWVSQKQLCKEYNKTKITCLPSFYETFGNVVLESLACNTPVICGENVTAGKMLNVIRTKTNVNSITQALTKTPPKIPNLNNFKINNVLKKEYQLILKNYEKKNRT